MSAGWSAQAQADAKLREAQPTGLFARIKAALGLSAAPSAAAQAEAARWAAGAEGERRTADLVHPLAEEGWFGLFDRHIPDLDSANADIVLVSPSGEVVVIDAKLWHRRAEVRAVNGRLFHGETDYGDALRSVLVETSRIERSLHEVLSRRSGSRALRVTPLIAMHNAPVAGGGFTLDGVQIVPADQLRALLRKMAGRPDPVWAAYVAGLAEQLLPRYAEGGPQ
ncbi:nuclease-related domain-containing protein [Streptomyces lasiicapitis]|uniref:nuclease-related domain-containing protein n=1 Tax=Streptomyces lasiicapitis TaxID=1923961 RepID=UPI0033192524